MEQRTRWGGGACSYNCGHRGVHSRLLPSSIQLFQRDLTLPHDVEFPTLRGVTDISTRTPTCRVCCILGNALCQFLPLITRLGKQIEQIDRGVSLMPKQASDPTENSIEAPILLRVDEG